MHVKALFSIRFNPSLLRFLCLRQSVESVVAEWIATNRYRRRTITAERIKQVEHKKTLESDEVMD